MTKKVLVLLDNPFTNDRRVYREAKCLHETGFQIQLIGTKQNGLPEVENVEGIRVLRIFENDIFDPKKPLSFKKYALWIHNRFDFDIIHANDQTMLHLGVKLKKIRPNVLLVYDSHELFHAWPINTDGNILIRLKSFIVRNIQIWREKRNSLKIDGLITVNYSILKDLQNYFKYDGPGIFIRNIPELPPDNFKSNILREKFNIPDHTKILVYIGANIYPRTINIEQVIIEFKNVDELVMVFICSDNWGRHSIENFCKVNSVKNVFFHDLIASSEIPSYLSSATVGIVSAWNKFDLSYWYGLDNKLFEYMMSELPILATQQPEYVKIVEKNQIGICIYPDNDGKPYLEGFYKIIDNIDFYIENIKETKLKLNWNIEKENLIQFYKHLI